LAVDRETAANRRDVVVYFIDRAVMAPVGEIMTTAGMTGNHTFPSLSKDGRQVVWSRDFPDDGLGGFLWKADLDGSNAHPIQSEGKNILGTQPVWEPHGERLAFVSPSFHVLVYDQANGYWWDLGKGQYPTWSPDGRWIAFTGEDRNLRVVSSYGEPFGLGLSSSWAITPRWSPTGRSILVATSWDFPEVVEVTFASNLFEVRDNVATATWASPDHLASSWAALEVVPAMGGSHTRIQNLATGESSFESGADERHPDWWAANPAPAPDMGPFESWLDPAPAVSPFEGELEPQPL
jgi:hypothetical protein